MIKFEHTDVCGWEHAIRGMRNPLASWHRSDSEKGCDINRCSNCGIECSDFGCECKEIIVGPNDLDLMKRLDKAGTDHRKFMRMLVVYVDIAAPLYWWKEFDTYKVGTVANSCSTMHKIHAKKFTLDDFSHEHLDCLDIGGGAKSSHFMLQQIVHHLNACRDLYLETRDKDFWWHMIQLLPSSYNQKRTVMLNYEVLANIYKSRKDHKLDEWHEFCHWIESLPHSGLITGNFEEEQ